MLKRNFMKRAISVLVVLAVFVTTVFSADLQVEASSTQYFEKGNSNYRNVMYYGDWSTGSREGYFNPDKIPADKLTHLNFAFLDFDRKGNLQWSDKDASVHDVAGIEGAVAGAANAGILSGFIDLRAKNPNLRIGVSVGGWAKSGDFTAVSKDPAIRKKFANNLAQFVKYAQMDFVDVDWEYPGNVREPEYMDNHTNEGTPESCPEDMVNYILLLKDIRASLDELSKEVFVPDYAKGSPTKYVNKYYELSVAISANENVLDEGTDVKEVFKVCDFVNVMTYDTTGQWNSKTGHHTALKTNPVINNRSVENTVNFLLKKGAIANKIVVGCAFYSRGWQSVVKGTSDVNITGLPGLGWTANTVTPGTNGYLGNSNGTNGRGADNYHPTTWGDGGYAAGNWPYFNFNDLKARYPELKYYYDEAAEAPYYYADNGAFFTFDDERSVAAKAKYVKDNKLGGLIAWMQSHDGETITGSGVRDKLTTTMKDGLFGSASLTNYAQIPEGADVGISYVYNKATNEIDFSLRNKSSLIENKEVLKEAEESYKTIFTPTLYIKMKSGNTLSCPNCDCIQMVGDIAIVYLYEKNDMIHPRDNVKFSLKPNQNNSYGIDSIILTQRIVPTASEFYKKLLTWSEWEASTIFETPAPKAIPAPTLAFNTKLMEFDSSQTVHINNDVKGSTYTWSSSNTKVATVSEEGNVEGVGAGTAVISCIIKTTNKAYTLNETITVVLPPVLSESTKTINVGKTHTFKINNQLGGSTYAWKSSNTKVATVTSGGKVKGISEGKANITCDVKTPIRTYCLKAVITIQKPAPKFAVTKKTLKLGGSNYTLKINNQISKSTYKWTSSKTSIASVSQKGTIKALKPGTSTITCTVKAPGKTYTLKAKITVTGPKMSKATINLKRGKSTQLKVLSRVSGSKYTFTSAKKSIATVTSKGKVKGIKKGSTYVNVKITFPKKLGIKAMTLKTKINVK